MPGILNILDVSFGLTGLFLVQRLLASQKHGTPLPPGPKKWPLIGNLLDIPTSKEWLTFADWADKWGDLVSVSAFNQQMIIVDSFEVAISMLDRKGSIYSDRPVIPMGGEMVGWKHSLVLQRYGERLRSYRRHFHKLIGSNQSMEQYHMTIEMATHKFLKRLLTSPQYLADHVRKTAGAIILRISHGYEVIEEGEDPLVKLADVAVEQFAQSTAPGAFLVNLVPALSSLPDWFPGTGFKTIAREWADTLTRISEEPHRLVKDQLNAGVAPSSFTANLLQEPGLTPEKEFEIKWSALSLYTAGADTTVASIYAFFGAMALFPQVAAKAQAEIDSVIGSEKLPSLSDRNNLPYVNALVLEVLRWHTVGPTGIPHVVMEDDIHDGYLIPKGALIIPNLWRMLHNPKSYPDPMAFNPDRFLGPNPQLDPRQICFGFGRRICPGRIMAEASVFSSCAMTLAVFNISKYMEDGRVIEPIVEQKPGVISHPTSFQCTIKPRSEKALALIKAEI